MPIRDSAGPSVARTLHIGQRTYHGGNHLGVRIVSETVDSRQVLVASQQTTIQKCGKITQVPDAFTWSQ